MANMDFGSTSTKLQQRIIINFIAKADKKDEYETYLMLKRAYGDQCMPRAIVRAYFNEYSKRHQLTDVKEKIEYSVSI